MTEVLDGFYSAYFTGKAGNGLGIFLISNGIIVGADASGGVFDGKYLLSDDGATLVGDMMFRLTPFAPTIQGVDLDETGRYYTKIEFLVASIEHNFFQIDTPIGPINVRLKKIRDV